jgi:hypothetical protein
MEALMAATAAGEVMLSFVAIVICGHYSICVTRSMSWPEMAVTVVQIA